MNKKGFTLIELLVVVAIIGILASVVIASLSSARGKGNDAAIKQNLNSARNQAELLYNDGFNYNGLCTNATIEAATDEADDVNGGGSTNTNGSVTCALSGSTPEKDYAIAADLSSEDGAYCIDSSGVGRTVNSSGTAYTGDLEGATPALSGATDTDCN